MLYSSTKCYIDPYYESNDFMGYVLMVLAFSFVFVGVRSFRDKHLNGFISFGKAFVTGLYISAVASLLYVAVWLVDYYVFIPDFLDSLTEHMLYQAKQDGATAAELDAKAAQMAEFAEMYKNPLFVIIATFLETFPIGLFISFVSALILRRRPDSPATAHSPAVPDKA